MARNARRKYGELNFCPHADADDLYDDSEFDIGELAWEIFSTEWGDDFETEERFSARRKIERRDDMRKLYSQLDDFEEFGDPNDW